MVSSPLVQRLTQAFSALPEVLSIAIAGSHATQTSDESSDIDLYVYAVRAIDLDMRRKLAPASAEIDNRFFETGDEWIDTTTGTRVDIMYRTPEWIESRLDRLFVHHEAALGYSTCLWDNVAHSQTLFDPRGWYEQLQRRCDVAYPEALRRAIARKNWPLLRRNQSSYRHQIALALQRNDGVSRQHRVTALLASFFDIWFALERRPHPGEKRLLTHLPTQWATLVQAVLDATPETLLSRIDALLDPLDERVLRERVLDTTPSVAHAAAWVADLERASGFYAQWFGAHAGAKYTSVSRPFSSRLLSLHHGARLELMQLPGEAPRMAHVAFTVGSRDAVHRMVEAMRASGVEIVGEPRITGDGFYEAVVRDPEGNAIEIVAGDE